MVFQKTNLFEIGVSNLYIGFKKIEDPIYIFIRRKTAFIYF